VIGIVVLRAASLAADALIAHGNEIKDWFTQTQGARQTNSCSGTLLRS
jgi:hypothetical protein